MKIKMQDTTTIQLFIYKIDQNSEKDREVYDALHIKKLTGAFTKIKFCYYKCHI